MMEDHDAQQAKELLGPGWTVPDMNQMKKNPYQPQDEKDAISSTSILQINGLCYTFTTLLIQSLEFNSAEPMIERLEFERTELIVDNVDLEEIFEKYRSECENNLSE
ncbi:5907_t:CDS:2 [Rhizophagus irregularis]|nr:5907_t:CDS:2 [Rhizophagus irregularis]